MGTGFGEVKRGGIELEKLGLGRLEPLTILELSIVEGPSSLLMISGRSEPFSLVSARVGKLFLENSKFSKLRESEIKWTEE